MKKILTIIILLCLFSTASYGFDNWKAKSEAIVGASGTVEAFLPLALHRYIPDSKMYDLSLIGPDGNSRALNLYWKEAQKASYTVVHAKTVILLDDKRILWEADVNANSKFNHLVVTVGGKGASGKLSFEVKQGSDWVQIASDIAIQTKNNQQFAEVNFDDTYVKKMRLYFTGLNDKFEKAHLFTKKVVLSGDAFDAALCVTSTELKHNEVKVKDFDEIRMELPGSGLRIIKLQIKTKAFFKGSWQLGKESIVLGKKEFVEYKSGKISKIDSDSNTILLDIGEIWPERSIIVRLKSDNYFGEIKKIECYVMVPKMVFVADQPGKYTLETGHNKPVGISEFVSKTNLGNSSEISFGTTVTDEQWQPESILQKFAIKGGPFNPDGYNWRCPFDIKRTGFYELPLSSEICLNEQISKLRIAFDNAQIPYFIGSTILGETDMKFSCVYDKQANRSTYSIKFPARNSRLPYIDFYAGGIFNRNLVLQKHVSGKVGWQDFKYVNWVKTTEQSEKLRISMANFPSDLKELRVVINNGSNEPLKITKVLGEYYSNNLYFVATSPGKYFLYGGNDKANSAKYDLSMVQDKLINLLPLKINCGARENLTNSKLGSSLNDVKGAAFDDSGYSWVATFAVTAPGLTQVILSDKASLDSNPDAFRIVKDGIQIPYFKGNTTELRTVNIQVNEEYDKNKNISYYMVKLPIVSNKWNQLELHASGVFNRTPLIELRKSGNLGWKTWKKMSWTGLNQNETILRIPLSSLPKGETELRIIIENGDNSAIKISKILALYQTHDLFFIAGNSGEYSLYGGNSDGKTPSYDISLIKNKLLKSEPNKVKIGKLVTKSTINVKKQLKKVFSDKGWGLYIVLGIVTLILVVMIFMMFPEVEPEKKENDSEKKTE